MRALIRFHAGAGARVAQRNSIVVLCVIIIVLGFAPDPVPVVVRRLVLETVTGGGVPVFPLLAVGLARQGVRTLLAGTGGWMRSLPVSGREHRRTIAIALGVVQVPLVTWVALCAVAAPAVYGVPVSVAKLAGVPMIVIAAGVTAAPGRWSLVATPLALAAALLAGVGRWPLFAASVVLLAVADVIAGPLRVPTAPSHVVGAGRWIALRLAWHAIGWRAIGAAVLAVVPVVFDWFYLTNNSLAPNEGFVGARLCGAIAVVLWHAALADLLVALRPPWPWARSLPWSARSRVLLDALAMGAPALLVAIALAAMRLAAAVAVVAMLPLVALVAAGAIRGARERLTGAGGAILLVGIPIVTLTAVAWWGGAVCLALAPAALLWAERAERRVPVTRWAELHHDAAGDPLSWSAR